MVISDGAPVDDSTLSANPGNYLEQHLRKVIEWIEQRSPVELLAIGIGHGDPLLRRAVCNIRSRAAGRRHARRAVRAVRPGALAAAQRARGLAARVIRLATSPPMLSDRTRRRPPAGPRARVNQTDVEPALTALDIAAFAVIGLSVLVAFLRGFLRETLTIITWLRAGVAAYFAFPYARELARRTIETEWRRGCRRALSHSWCR